MRFLPPLGAILFAAWLALPAAAAPYPGQVAAAEAGNPRAQFALAIMYDTGDGVLQDFPTALVWFRRAAEGGYDVAEAKLGLMYLVGWAVARDPAEAARWYRKAADQGNLIAQIRLARLYAAGIGVPRSLVEAALWARLAAAEGDALAAWLADRYAERMTPAEIAQADRRARSWRPAR
jgi:TPR repeat protein